MRAQLGRAVGEGAIGESWGRLILLAALPRNGTSAHERVVTGFSKSSVPVVYAERYP